MASKMAAAKDQNTKIPIIAMFSVTDQCCFDQSICNTLGQMDGIESV